MIDLYIYIFIGTPSYYIAKPKGCRNVFKLYLCTLEEDGQSFMTICQSTPSLSLYPTKILPNNKHVMAFFERNQLGKAMKIIVTKNPNIYGKVFEKNYIILEMCHSLRSFCI